MFLFMLIFFEGAVAALSQESFMFKVQTGKSVNAVQQAVVPLPRSIVDAGIEVLVVDDESLKLVGGAGVSTDPVPGMPLA
jgi:hypothetical protein